MSLDITFTHDKCPHCGHAPEYMCFNITHNLGRMAEACDVYHTLWRPEEIGISIAGQMIEPLRQAVARLKASPEHFRQFDSPNGWGLYVNFLPFCEKVLAYCIANPDARVEADR